MRLLGRCSVSIVLFIMVLSFASCRKKDNGIKKGNGNTTNIPSKEGMVYIPEGWFNFSLDPGGQKKKKIFIKGFYIDKYEVSNREYARFIKAGGYSNKQYWTKAGWTWVVSNKILAPRWWSKGRYHNGMEFPDYPVSGISWYEASAYAKWAGKRLPTEAEWEKASRGSDGRRFPWGAHGVMHKKVFYANFGSYKDGHIYSSKVKSFPQGKSPFGCYNMLGNVWEWVSDWKPTYDYFKNVPERNPKGAVTGTKRQLRGGSWYKAVTYYEDFYRLAVEPGSRKYDDVGFRCAMDLP